MASFKCSAIVFFAVLTFVAMSVDAVGFFSRRRDQRNPKPYERPLSSHFRQRLGTSGRNPASNYYNSPRELQPSQAALSSDRDGYASSTTYTSASSTYDNYPAHEGSNPLNPLSVLVAPLAALALVGAAAAVATNPVLLTVATLSSGRKRRDLEQHTGDHDDLTPEIENKLHEMEVLEKYIASAPEHEKQQERLMASYLSCSGFTETQNACMDRVVCEYSVQPNKMSSLEKDVISIVLFNIMANGYVTDEFKDRLRSAAQYGRGRGHCNAYQCSQLKKN